MIIESQGVRIKGEVTEDDGGEYIVRAYVLQTGRLHQQRISVEVQGMKRITNDDMPTGTTICTSDSLCQEREFWQRRGHMLHKLPRIEPFRILAEYELLAR